MRHQFDVVGLGVNATDQIIRVPAFPGPGGKVWYSSENRHVGGQLAVALTVCRRFGLRAAYIGTVGDDDAADFQIRNFEAEGIDLRWLRRIQNSSSLKSYIFVDEASGERTIIFDRPSALVFPANAVTAEMAGSAPLLHVDSHDAAASAAAAELARKAGGIVVADVHRIDDLPAIEQLLANVDYLIASQTFPSRLTGIKEPPQALHAIRQRFGMVVAALTLGAYGVLALSASGYCYVPGLEVEVVDTTGAGDVFHGAFLVALYRRETLEAALEFSSAMAALNCTAAGACGYIATDEEVEKLILRGRRIIHPELAAQSYNAESSSVRLAHR